MHHTGIIAAGRSIRKFGQHHDAVRPSRVQQDLVMQVASTALRFLRGHQDELDKACEQLVDSRLDLAHMEKTPQTEFEAKKRKK